jgi:outer membrane protein assembly factor BamB
MFNLPKTICGSLSSLYIFVVLTILCLTIYPQKFEGKIPVVNNCWFYSTSETTDYEIASDNANDLYIPLLDGKLLSINSKNAEKNWEAVLAGDIISAPLVTQENVYVLIKINDEDGKENNADVLYSLSKITGITQWQIRLTSSNKVKLYDSGNNIILIFANGIIYSVAKLDGRINWQKSLGTEISAFPFITTNEIILGAANKQINILSPSDGKLIEKFEISAQPTVIAENATRDNLVLGDNKGNLWSLNRKKKTRNWGFRQGAEISNITHTAQGVLVSSFDNFVYLFSETSGKLIWKKRLRGRIAAAPQINGGNFVIASIDESEALVIDLGSGKLVNKIALDNGNFFSGESIKLKNLFIYTTRKGIYSFSLTEEGCGELSEK